jgi:hypothetical protein
MVLEELNSGIYESNVGIKIPNGVLVLVVINNQGTEILQSCGSHLEKGVGKWYRGTKGVWRGGWDYKKKGCQMIDITGIMKKGGMQRDMIQIKV